jgi:hypothetical protein
MAVMSEFLERGYNVAVPEVDVGDDIFVVRDSSGVYVRVQVKTSTATETRRGSVARYSLRLSQLAQPTVPETWYALVQRRSDHWGDFFLISRPQLYEYFDVDGIGSVNARGYLNLYVKFEGGRAWCSGIDLSRHLNDWSEWPPIDHGV